MKKSDEIREKIKKKEEQIEKRKKTTEKYVEKKDKLREKLEKAGIDLTKIDDYEYRRSFSDELMWDMIDYPGTERDIKDSNSKQKVLEAQLARLQEQLEKQLNKENVPKIPAIEALLDQWEEKARVFIDCCQEENQKRRDAYRESLAILTEQMGLYSQTYHQFHYDLKYKRMDMDKAKEKYASSEGRFKVTEKAFEKMKVTYKLEEAYNSFDAEHRVFLELYGDEEKTQRFIRNEKEARRIDLINRVTDVVGEIVDATHLRFGLNDGINGVVIGKKGKANVQTIDAGGYNIQRYHYRVLVHPIKEKESLEEKIASAEKRSGQSGEERGIAINRGTSRQ